MSRRHPLLEAINYIHHTHNRLVSYFQWKIAIFVENEFELKIGGQAKNMVRKRFSEYCESNQNKRKV